MSSPPVHFYTLSSERYDSAHDALIVACRLTEKAVGRGHQVYIHTASQLQAQQLDDLLWQFRDTSFLPHGLANDSTTHDQPVTIGEQPPSDQFSDMLINLSNQAVASVGRFSRVNELVGPDEASLVRGRDRYRHYKTQNVEIATYKL